MMVYLRISYIKLISALTTTVADIMSKKPSNTENTFDFADSLASALTGSTMISPIQTITPIAIILVIIWTLRISVAIMSRKSDPDSVALKLTSS